MSDRMKLDITKPDLINRDLGYLKVPEQIRKEYGSPKRYPAPDASLEMTDDEIRLIFKFPRMEMESLKEVRE